jgi:hypothetical protein
MPFFVLQIYDQIIDTDPSVEGVCKYNEKNEIKKIDKKMQSNSFYFQI